ncbi:DUF4232 domain-containing protein [Streptomyces sp. NPDC007157]|uniref:DUF4232 domain-containing protein n=1 Tax=Streptomyces sp. NPDC007157 TaxID=3154681 RepID=UPI0033F7A2AF
MKATTARRALPVLALALTGMALTACGPGTDGASSGGSSAAAGADASSGTSSTGGRAAADGSSSSTSNGRSAGQDQGSGSDGGPGACAASNLKVAEENPDSGASTTHFQLVFQNTGAIPCTLSGFPGVSFRGRDGAQIGNAATRDSGTSVTTVTLLPNGHATADVSASDGRSGFSADECKLTDVSFIGVYAPGSKDMIDVPWKAQECGGRGVDGLRAGPVHRVR